MAAITRRSGLAAALGVLLAFAQAPTGTNPGVSSDEPAEVRLPNGKLQKDEILKAEYAANLKDARELTDLAKSFELDLEKNDRFVLSLGLLKKLDDIEKITKRIRVRMRR